MASWAVRGLSRLWMRADMPGVKGMLMSASGRHQKPRSARITRTSWARENIAPAAKVCPCSAATVTSGSDSIRARSPWTEVT
jgi:hypothetical protein